LIPLEFAAFLLHRRRESLLQEVEAGRLKFVFDLRARDGSKSFLRIWRRSVLACQTGNYPWADESAVLEDVLPSERQVTSLTLAESFGCDADSIYRIARYFTVLQRGSRGPGCSAVYDRDSCAAWLLKRRVA